MFSENPPEPQQPFRFHAAILRIGPRLPHQFRPSRACEDPPTVWIQTRKGAPFDKLRVGA